MTEAVHQENPKIHTTLIMPRAVATELEHDSLKIFELFQTAFSRKNKSAFMATEATPTLLKIHYVYPSLL